MMKRKVILDADGVLTNITTSAIEYIRNEYGTVITEDDVTGWDWEYSLGLPHTGNPFWSYIWESPVTIYPGALEFVEAIKNLNYEVRILSTRPTESAKAAAHRDFPIFGLEYVLVNKNDHKVAHVAAEPNVKFVVEDNPKNAVAIGTHSNAEVLLLTRPWNASCISVTNAYTRVHNYDHILGILETYEE